MKFFRPVAVVLIICLFAGTGSAVWAQEKTAPKKSPAVPQAASSYDVALLQPAALVAKAPEVYEVKFVTTKGDFTVKVTRAWAPNGADRFYNLVQHHFYDGASFFRAVPGFVVQFGLSAQPEVNNAWVNARIRDDKVTKSNKRATITFATSGLNSRTTQVFINLNDGNAQLDTHVNNFAPFGEVTVGMNIVESLYNGYGDATTNKQGEIAAGGKAYLDKNFPKLDIIKSATLLPPAPTPPAKKTP